MYKHNIDEMADLLFKAGVIRPGKEEQARNALIGYWADKMALIWTAQDVIDCCPNLTEEQAVEVLYKALHDHGYTIGITWETFRTCAQVLDYDPGEPKEDDEEDA